MEHHTRSGAALLAVCGAGLLAAVAQPANAGVVEMTFESLAHADNGLALHGSQYQENGFQLTAATGQFSTYGSAAFNYPGSTAMIASQSPEVITLTAIGGGAFDLLSIELAKRDTSGSIFPVNVTFTGTKSDSSTVTATFHGTVSGVLLQEFTLPATFTDLTQVAWSGTQPHQFDNVTVVPAPGFAAVLAFGGCLAMRRRR